MKVSLITCTYNSEATIKATLESVAAQGYSNIEHIIQDGNSTDETLTIVKEISPGSQIYSEPDTGIYDALNKGIQKATGDIIGILHSDDFLIDNAVIQKIVNTLEANQTDSVYGNLEYVDRENTSKVVRNWQSGTYNISKFLYGWMPPHPTFYVKREIYERLGLFDLDLKSAADYELMLRFLFKHKISTTYIPEVLVKMRVGGMSNASLLNRLRGNKEDRIAWKKNGLQPKFYTTWLKPLRKLNQYF